MLQSVGLQRVVYNLLTEQHLGDFFFFFLFSIIDFIFQLVTRCKTDLVSLYRAVLISEE